MDIQYLIIALIGLVLFVRPDKVVRTDTLEKQKQLIMVIRVCGVIMFVAGLIVAFIR